MCEELKSEVLDLAERLGCLGSGLERRVKTDLLRDSPERARGSLLVLLKQGARLSQRRSDRLLRDLNAWVSTK